MPLIQSISVNDGLLWVWKITETPDDLLSLPTHFPEKAAEQKITNDKRRIERLITHALLNDMIGPAFQLSYDSEGRPILRNEIYKYISITHSADYVGIIVHKYLPVGIDVESTRRKFNAIAHRFLSTDEMEKTANEPILQCLFWCTKEAVFKLVEESGIDFRKQINVCSFNFEAHTIVAQYLQEHSETTIDLNFLIFDESCLVWACGKSN
jgi:phosphopantetheinyl transferase